LRPEGGGKDAQLEPISQGGKEGSLGETVRKAVILQHNTS